MGLKLKRGGCGLVLMALAGVAGASGLEQLHGFLEGTHAGKAEFAQTVTAKSGKKPQQASGSMMFVRPGKFRWTYDKPYYQLIVGDGVKLWIFDKDLNQVTVKKLGQALGAARRPCWPGTTPWKKTSTSRRPANPMAWNGWKPRRRPPTAASAMCASA